ncbi:uncharacterized protein TRUGW13939_09739 [Talaromyces rugulosus]|uniref:Uncharacterized protein n=1 Tax=Talaromyces rugulosus TaxID=121627 RepID=A0A7H8R9G2_TALRU|nr:uncharacterized protein TRUGW13939_09739 [Talaromyces rugulosus]QKX62578.1 hypothetical protein TRUGW13939_09739 [Talaromyces rugulosus]
MVDSKGFSSTAVVIIGAGISGLCAAVDLIKRNNCRDFVILEKSADLGGTWYDNIYPGCGCDVECVLYSYTFAQNSAWTRLFPEQKEILSYLINVAREYKLYQHIFFKANVEEAAWDDDLKKWRTRFTIAADVQDSQKESLNEIESLFLISAVGQLSQPQWPGIEGLETFDGKVMHSARWDWSYDMANKNIAIIGTGCSGVQLLPEIAKVAGKVTVFQRSPNWIFPRLDKPISRFTRMLYRFMPPLLWHLRLKQMISNEGQHSALVDPEGKHAGMFRQMALAYMRSQLPNKSDMWEKLTPSYSFGCKRPIVSDDFYQTLSLAHINLETRPIKSISGHNITVSSAESQHQEHDICYDLIICATGFKTVDFMHPILIYGKNKRPLRDVWKDGARAYLGTCVDDMPNFAMLFGPNTSIVHNSIILQIESQSRYINGLIRPILEAQALGQSLILSPKREKLDEYNRAIQGKLQKMSFNDTRCRSWYKTASGLITNAWPGGVLDYQILLQQVMYDDYEIEGSGKSIVLQRPVCDVGSPVFELQVRNYRSLAISTISAAAVITVILYSSIMQPGRVF